MINSVKKIIKLGREIRKIEARVQEIKCETENRVFTEGLHGKVVFEEKQKGHDKGKIEPTDFWDKSVPVK